MDTYTTETDERALAPIGSATAGAQVAAPGQWDREQKAIIKDVLAPGISDGELLLFGVICQRTGLDPFLKQIYAIMRNQKLDNGQWGKRMTVQTSIDGYRLLAARTHEYAGSDEAEFGPEEDGHPTWARVTVWRFVQGQRCPFTHTVRWREYVQRDKDGKPIGKWADMPYNQLAKCGEAGSLRKGFPAELSGLYINEEMDQAENEPHSNISPMPPRPLPTNPATPAPTAKEPTPLRPKPSWASLRKRALDAGIGNMDDWEAVVSQMTGKPIANTTKWTAEDYRAVEQYVADMELKQREQAEAVEAEGGAE